MFPNTFKFAFQEVGMKFHISESEKWGWSKKRTCWCLECRENFIIMTRKIDLLSLANFVFCDHSILSGINSVNLHPTKIVILQTSARFWEWLLNFNPTNVLNMPLSHLAVPFEWDFLLLWKRYIRCLMVDMISAHALITAYLKPYTVV